MDQRASAVEEDLRNILRTRMALADKIQLLEQRVEETLQGTKATALSVIDHAKNTAVDIMESATHTFDPAVLAGRRPWMLVGSAVAIGFLAGWMGQYSRRSGIYPYYLPRAGGAQVMPSQEKKGETPSGVYPFYPIYSTRHKRPTPGRGSNPFGRSEHVHSRSAEFSWSLKQVPALLRDFTGEWTTERARLQGAAVEAGRSFIRDLARIAGQALIDQLSRPGAPRIGYAKKPYEPVP